MHKYSSLYDFIDSAVRSRKYADNYAYALKSALKLFEAELNEDEKGSIELFRDRLDQIYKSVFAKNAKRFNASSLSTYKARVIKVLNDYERYGIDPTKMATWSPKKKAAAQSKKKTNRESNFSSEKQQDDVFSDSISAPAFIDAVRGELPLSSGKIVIFLPKQRNESDVKRIRQYMDLLLGPEEENDEKHS